MNRLSSYAQNESNVESKDKQKSEEEAVAALLEKVRISKETEAAKAKEAKAKAEQPNGDQVDSETSGINTPQESEAPAEEDKPPSANGTEDAETTPGKKTRGIPPNVKLFEIFYGQVTHLVQAQRLPIQDTIALLVSLANLAL